MVLSQLKGMPCCRREIAKEAEKERDKRVDMHPTPPPLIFYLFIDQLYRIVRFSDVVVVGAIHWE